MLGHDEDGGVGDHLHRGLHVALLGFHAAQGLNVQSVGWGEKTPELSLTSPDTKMKTLES